MKIEFVSVEVQDEVLNINRNNFILYRFKHYSVHYPTYNSYLFARINSWNKFF
jgi:hypothetical protein